MNRVGSTSEFHKTVNDLSRTSPAWNKQGRVVWCVCVVLVCERAGMGFLTHVAVSA